MREIEQVRALGITELWQVVIPIYAMLGWAESAQHGGM